MPLSVINTVRAARWGAIRVRTAFEGLPDYPQRIGNVERDKALAYGEASQWRVRAAQFSEGLLDRSGLHVRTPAKSGVLFIGGAPSDLRRFDFVEDLLGTLPAEGAYQRYMAIEGAARSFRRGEVMSLRGAVLPVALESLKGTTGGSPYLAHRLKIYFSNFIRFAVAFADMRDSGQRLTVVSANDHSPAQVAACAAARIVGFKTVYIQHAPIGAFFPPLDFDLSILFDDHTYRIYKQIGEPRGRVVIGSAYADCADVDRLMRSINTQASVGLFLPSFAKDGSLRAIIANLENNENITRLLIKPHPVPKASLPNISSDKSEFLHRNVDNQKLAQEIDVAIAGNSGVALELLHAGVPVFYVPDVDHFANDTYGFVKAQLTPQRNIEDLRTSFWIRTASELGGLEKSLPLFDPTIRSKPSELREQIRAALEGLINPC